MIFFISFLAGVALFYSFQYFPFTSVIAALVTLSFSILKRKYLFVPAIILGILYAFFRYVPEHDYSYITGKEMLVSGVFDSGPVDTASEKFIQTFHIDSAIDSNTDVPLEEFDDEDIKIISDAEFEVGSQYELIIEAGKSKTRFNPGGINNNDLYAYLHEVEDFKGDKKSIWATFQKTRAELNRRITNSFSPDSAALISAITTGERSEMSEELRNAFNSTGLAHILSISGTHFGLFSVFLFWIFRFLIKHLPYKILQRITIYLTPSQGAAILCIPFMTVYLGLSGWSIPALRAFIMIGLFLFGLLIGRKGFWLNSLLFAALVIVLWSPDAIFSLSFQLSFIAVLFIGLIIGYESAESNSKGILKIFKKTMGITLAASLGTAPLVAYHFHYFSVISPLSNLFITPLIGFVLLPLSLLSAFIFLFTGQYVLTPLIGTVADFVVYSVMNVSRIPFAEITIPAFPVIVVICIYALIAVYILTNKKTFILIIASAFIIISISLPLIWKKHHLTITYLDVGQGDASVVELPDKKLIVVDTGSSGKEAAGFFKYIGRQTIEALVLSHSHPDHTGGVDYLLKHFMVKELWDNGRLIYPEGFSDGINHKVLERGDVIEGKDYKIYVFHPYKEFYTMNGDEYTEENNSSLVLKIEGKQKSFLFAGDIEEDAEGDIIHLSRWIKSDVIKVPHHGGKTSASRIFFDAVSPEVAVISVGRDNSFGHPHDEMLEVLGGVMSNPPPPPFPHSGGFVEAKAKGGEGGFISAAKIYRTDIDGAIKITEKDGNGLEIKTYRDFQFTKAKSIDAEIKNIKRLFMVW